MGNRINELFTRKSKDILSIYFTAGYPQLEDTMTVISELENHGIDMIELGVPFSAPVADGPVIQESSKQALANGMSLSLLFDQLVDLRKTVKLPIVLMSYFNPIARFGFEKLCQKCKEVGIDGLIVPDLPFSLYTSKYKKVMDSFDLRMTMLITPETADERMIQIDEQTNSFLYMVSSNAITGAQESFEAKKVAYFQRVNALPLKNPKLIGFGISNKETLQTAFDNSSGAIIGSKFVSLLRSSKSIKDAVENLLQDLKK